MGRALHALKLRSQRISRVMNGALLTLAALLLPLALTASSSRSLAVRQHQAKKGNAREGETMTEKRFATDMYNLLARYQNSHTNPFLAIPRQHKRYRLLMPADDMDATDWFTPNREGIYQF
ncbi:hypothetical protein Tcan_01479 [Toxocara canis]|uniref:Uncharacterized protein n=1 Tax=Toxocara canis TaxID=6265 RepID=A0A0B2VGQ3_TOXCA|nr:hypothetical protein Tcan_01479 [Toxocara canis]